MKFAVLRSSLFGLTFSGFRVDAFTAISSSVGSLRKATVNVISCRCSSSGSTSSTSSLSRRFDTKIQMDANNEVGRDDKEFWMRQKQLIQEIEDASDVSRRVNAREKFKARRLALVGDTAYIGFIIFCLLWTFSANPFVSLSYVFGTTCGLAYAYGLGKYVETIGASVDDPGAIEGAGVGNARFAFLILLFIFVGKFRSVGLVEIPSISGFFTYQLASLSQGLREIDDN